MEVYVDIGQGQWSNPPRAHHSSTAWLITQVL